MRKIAANYKSGVLVLLHFLKRLKLLPLIATLLIVIAVQPGVKKTWSPPPVAQRFGPLAYDSEISRPLNSLITASESRPTDLTLQLRFVQRSLPIDYAFLVSTAVGFGRGLKVSSDKYGNIYLSIGRPNDAVDDYQLVKLSDPLPLGTSHELVIKVSTLDPSVTVEVDGREVEVRDARPNTYFLPKDVFLNVSNLEIGGSSGKDFVGELAEVEVVFGTASTSLNGTALRILLLLMAAVLIFVHLGHPERRWGESRFVDRD